MANSVTTQLILDGPRNVVFKVSGLLDTSDVAATGTIGASGFTTTTGSPIVAFVAGALPPTVGQFVTFSDGTTTFPAGTYIKSVTDATHVVMSNDALADNAAAAITITGTAGAIVLLDPSKLCGIDNTGTVKAGHFRIGNITYVIEDGLECRLWWDATADVLIEALTGRGFLEYQKRFGGLVDNSGAGSTGCILLSTQGWASSAVLSFSLVLELTKQQT